MKKPDETCTSTDMLKKAKYALTVQTTSCNNKDIAEGLGPPQMGFADNIFFFISPSGKFTFPSGRPFLLL